MSTPKKQKKKTHVESGYSKDEIEKPKKNEKMDRFRKDYEDESVYKRESDIDLTHHRE